MLLAKAYPVSPAHPARVCRSIPVKVYQAGPVSRNGLDKVYRHLFLASRVRVYPDRR